jgi:hypothetical protein
MEVVKLMKPEELLGLKTEILLLLGTAEATT